MYPRANHLREIHNDKYTNTEKIKKENNKEPRITIRSESTFSNQIKTKQSEKKKKTTEQQRNDSVTLSLEEFARSLNV